MEEGIILGEDYSVETGGQNSLRLRHEKVLRFGNAYFLDKSSEFRFVTVDVFHSCFRIFLFRISQSDLCESVDIKCRNVKRLSLQCTIYSFNGTGCG